MNSLYVNADDFGYNLSVNKAIIEVFENGLINSTTLMANMPGFDNAVELAHKHRITNKIGIHLVLTEGSPLTEEIKSVRFLFNGNKSYKESRFSMFFLKNNIKKLVYNELVAQIEKLKSYDIGITHIDTHHHIHEIFSITNILLDLRKKYNIPSIRILNNLEKPTRLYKKEYRSLINCYLKKTHSNFTDYFGSGYDFLIQFNKDPSIINKNIEIMVHPDYDCKGRLIDNACPVENVYNLLHSLNANTFKL